MKLLLTSAGFTNKSIANALFDLVGKRPEDTSIVFIPTASNEVMGDKTWVIDDLKNIKKQNFKSIDIADISALDEKIWKAKFEQADVLFFEGGDTFHLMTWINKSGLVKIIPQLLKNKIYVGLSAGSMVASKDLALKATQILFDEDWDKTEDMAGLNFVDFYCIPHLNSKHFPKLRENFIKEATTGMTETIYGLDDQSALKVIDGQVEVISEGEWFVLNHKINS